MSRVREDGQSAQRPAGQALETRTSAVSDAVGLRPGDGCEKRKGKKRTLHCSASSYSIKLQYSALSPLLSAGLVPAERYASTVLWSIRGYNKVAPEPSAKHAARKLATKATHHFRDQPDAHDFLQTRTENPIDSRGRRAASTSARKS